VGGEILTAQTCSVFPAYHHPRRLNQRIGSRRDSPNATPTPVTGAHRAQHIDMLWKFMPYMLAINVGGIPTADTIVSTLQISFCPVLIKPRIVSSRNCVLPDRCASKSTSEAGSCCAVFKWVEGGWDIAQTAVFARALEARGCAAIHVSSGGLDPAQRIPVGPSYQVPLARAVKAAVRVPVIAVGLFTEFEQAEAIVSTHGSGDLVVGG
jgi:hypothetical protein